jgi:hypothetical protein
MKTPFLIVSSTPPLVCVWLPTGTSRIPLACVWVSAETAKLSSISAAQSSEELGGFHLCA